MRLEKGTKAKRRKKSKTRILKWVLALVVILIVLMVFLVPAFVSSEKGRKIILAKINNSIDGKVDFAGLSMSWWKGIRVTDFRFNDSAGLAFVEIKQITTKPHYAAILFGTLSFGKTIIDEPLIVINLKPKPIHKTKVSPQKPAGNKESQLPMIPIKKIDLTVNNGNLKVTGRQAETLELAEINSRITINSPREYPPGQTEKLLANLNTKAKLGFEKAQYMGLNFGPTEVDIQIQNGLLKIAPFSTTVNTGQFNFAAEADFKQKPTLLRTTQPIAMKDIQINEVISQRFLVYVNPIFLNPVDATGVANFSAERLVIPLAGASKNRLEVIGTIAIDNLKLWPTGLLGLITSPIGQREPIVNMRIHPTRFVLRNGFVQYDDMQIDIGDNPVNFEGVIGLDKSLNMTVTLPYTLKGRTARVDKETVGQRISLPLRGTIEKPELDLGKLLEMQLRKQLEQELLKGLEGLFK